jgi:hypothetical protein
MATRSIDFSVDDSSGKAERAYAPYRKSQRMNTSLPERV